jgi:hypothetical protein
MNERVEPIVESVPLAKATRFRSAFVVKIRSGGERRAFQLDGAEADQLAKHFPDLDERRTGVFSASVTAWYISFNMADGSRTALTLPQDLTIFQDGLGVKPVQGNLARFFEEHLRGQGRKCTIGSDGQISVLRTAD